MVDSKMFIPKTIKVGFNKRDDTYTGKLAYVIYFDDKGKLRKEKSWQGWRNHKIAAEEYENEPTTGFVLNKGVGGARHSYGWNARNEYIRVYDPRNFEFEISVANLLFILQETSAIKGKGLEGEFVYAWDGSELVLLPVDCEEYHECVKHTERQKIKFDKNDIKEGFSYLMKDGTEVMYLGRFSYNNPGYWHKLKGTFNPVGKKHVFLRLKKEKYEDKYIPESGFTRIAERTSSSSLPQYPEEYDKFKKSIHSGDIKEVKLTKVEYSQSNLSERRFLIKEDDKYYVAKLRQNYYHSYYGANKKIEYYLAKTKTPFKPVLKNGTLRIPNISFSELRKEENGISLNSLKKKEFYTIGVLTEKGKYIEVI